MEIDIHRSLNHTHVVGFHGFFEDKDHVYILLELCRRRSLMELHRRRKALSEPEVRYYLRQTLLAVKYLHDTKVNWTMQCDMLNLASYMPHNRKILSTQFCSYRNFMHFQSVLFTGYLYTSLAIQSTPQTCLR